MSTFRVTCVYAGTNDPAKQTQKIEVTEGSSYRDILGRCGFPTSDVHVNVNRVAQPNLDATAGPNDFITVTKTNLKGATPAVVSFEDILKWGTGNTTVATDAVDKALNEISEEGAKQHTAIVKELVVVMKEEAGRVNGNIEKAQKALAAAEKDASELAYATSQLRTGNIFSLLGFAGRKDEAYYFCDKMGCAVPANNSPLWATSPPKADVVDAA